MRRNANGMDVNVFITKRFKKIFSQRFYIYACRRAQRTENWRKTDRGDYIESSDHRTAQCGGVRGFNGGERRHPQ